MGQENKLIEKVLSDFGVTRTVDGKWFLCKSEEGRTIMFKEYPSYEDIEIVIQTEDLDKLWEDFKRTN